ncbi:hypothetical protein BJX62DRAFT_237975 [Aspergillus germanicus]
MKQTTAPYDQDISHILSKHYDIDIKYQDKKYLNISKARYDDKKAIVPGFPYIKAAKERKAEQLWRCVDTTTEHELAKAIELKESTRKAESQLAGLRRRIDVVHPEHRLIRPKLEVILDALLSYALDSYRRSELEKKEKKKRHIFSLSSDKSKNPIADLVSITGDGSFSRRHCSKRGQEYYTATKVEHLVPHGEPEDLEVSAIIVRARKVGEDKTDHLLANMASIHEARLLAHEKNVEIWGIATDCERWTFAYIDSKSRCSNHRLTWPTHKNEIVFHIMRILSETMIRATKVARSLRPSRAAVWRQKVKRYAGDHEIHPSGLRIADRKRGRFNSRRDDFSGRFLDFEDD